ncbi:MAG: diaminopimelate epimerase [Chlamydiae bacterium]|nr:diaminopimelate epimerase [Chlamydiota bacterium]
MFISFSKYQGSGNDFVIIDDRATVFPCEKDEFIRKICHRRFGIGADGLLLLQTSACAGFKVRIFNSDGKEVSMCGNGLRCFVHYLNSLGFKEESYRIETMHDIIDCQIKGDKILVRLQKPYVMNWGVNLDVDDSVFEAYVVHTGVPHAVIFVDDLEQVNVEESGRRVRNHPLFAPEGVNVNFAKRGADGAFRVRTYERGVEGETYACGTGAAAVALAACQLWDVTSPVRIVPLSKESLEVRVEQAVSGGKLLDLIGGATAVFEGKFCLEQFL